MLSRGEKMARDHVVARSHDASGKDIGRAHANSIMDTKLYIKFMELTTNVIAQSIYAQCDADGN